MHIGEPISPSGPEGFEFYREFCFPVSQSSTSTALREIAGNPKKAVDSIESRISHEDSELAGVLETFRRSFRDRAEFYRVGSVYVYRALQAEAESRSKRLPPHARNFERYFITRYTAGGPYTRERDISELRRSEPILYSGVMQLGLYLPSRSVVIAGAVDVFTAFKNTQLLTPK